MVNYPDLLDRAFLTAEPTRSDDAQDARIPHAANRIAWQVSLLISAATVRT
ncbi:MAG: hypothetical protein H0V63_07775 [Burkholderiaceae bacterium]|nr:hypothetical protein [Burkholderiaceae bacterium]